MRPSAVTFILACMTGLYACGEAPTSNVQASSIGYRSRAPEDFNLAYPELDIWDFTWLSDGKVTSRTHNYLPVAADPDPSFDFYLDASPLTPGGELISLATYEKYLFRPAGEYPRIDTSLEFDTLLDDSGCDKQGGRGSIGDLVFRFPPIPKTQEDLQPAAATKPGSFSMPFPKGRSHLSLPLRAKASAEGKSGAFVPVDFITRWYNPKVPGGSVALKMPFSLLKVGEAPMKPNFTGNNFTIHIATGKDPDTCNVAIRNVRLEVDQSVINVSLNRLAARFPDQLEIYNLTLANHYKHLDQAQLTICNITQTIANLEDAFGATSLADAADAGGEPAKALVRSAVLGASRVGALTLGSADAFYYAVAHEQELRSKASSLCQSLRQHPLFDDLDYAQCGESQECKDNLDKLIGVVRFFQGATEYATLALAVNRQVERAFKLPDEFKVIDALIK